MNETLPDELFPFAVSRAVVSAEFEIVVFARLIGIGVEIRIVFVGTTRVLFAAFVVLKVDAVY